MTLTPADWPGGLAYLVVFVAALIEGEVVFIAAATLAGQGSLNALGVVAAGTLGAAAGDQIPFYLLRYHVRSWLDRLRGVRRVSGRLARAVTRRRALVAFLIRFAPGPQWLGRLGLSGWWTFAVPAVAVLITLKALAWVRRHGDVEAVAP
jgi:uncharacterized membrane protein YdjX (TVP38/TMEM64 family)